MEPHRFGRTLGIGLRVASRVVKDRAAVSESSPPGKVQTDYAAKGRAVADGSRRIARGGQRFGQAFFGPLRRAIRSLWLEITGVFFLLFAVFAGQSAWRLHADAFAGPGHSRFVVYCIVAAMFLYFSFSSFYRSWRKKA